MGPQGLQGSVGFQDGNARNLGLQAGRGEVEDCSKRAWFKPRVVVSPQKGRRVLWLQPIPPQGQDITSTVKYLRKCNPVRHIMTHKQGK